jgi:acetyl esterase/lipase
LKEDAVTKGWQTIGLDGEGDQTGLRLRVYTGGKATKPASLVLYLHGNAFHRADDDDAERPAARALAETGAVVVEADYGAPSDFAFPHVLEHAFAALSHVDGHRKQFGGSAKSPLFVAGNEAGGNVAAGVAFKARDRMPGRLSGQVLLSPMIDPLMTSVSIRKADDIGMRERWAEGWRHYLRSVSGGQHPYAAPCQCSRLFGVAPALLMTSEDDPLRDEALTFSGRLKDGGVRVREHVLGAALGWTGNYRQQTGRWTEALAAGFTAFVEEIRSLDRAPV